MIRCASDLRIRAEREIIAGYTVRCRTFVDLNIFVSPKRLIGKVI
jgi:hypothetical protein